MHTRTIIAGTITACLIGSAWHARAFQPIDESFGNQLWDCTHNDNVYATVEDGVECPEIMFSFSLPHARIHFGPNPPSDWMSQLQRMKIDDPDECVFGRRARR